MIGTLAAFAWLIASSVWGMTPSSAATTTTAMSVTRAPRARIAVNASWPGVSRKTTRLPSWTTSLAPMCWVMPPRSPAATSVVRMASSRLVLPWSTWPMTVTIGARGWRSGRVVLLEEDLLGRLGGGPLALVVGVAGRRPRRPRRPRSRARSATSDAVSRSMSWLMVAKMPLLISSRMTSAGLTAEQLGELLDGDRAGQLDRAALARIERSGRRPARTRRRDAAACGARAGRGCRSYSWPRAPPSIDRRDRSGSAASAVAQVGRERGLERPAQGALARWRLSRHAVGPADVGAAAGQRGRSGRATTSPVGRPDDAHELALRRAPSGRRRRSASGPTRRDGRRPTAAYDATSSVGVARPSCEARFGLAAGAAASAAVGAAPRGLGGRVGARRRRPPSSAAAGALRRSAAASAAVASAAAASARRASATAAAGSALRRRRRRPRPWRLGVGARPWPRRPRRRSGCRSASRSAWRPAGRSGPRGRWPARASARAR